VCTLEESIESLTKYGGFDLIYREKWPHPWRAALRSSHNNENGFRVRRFGDSPTEAVET